MSRWIRIFNESKIDNMLELFKKSKLYSEGFSLGRILNELIDCIKKYERNSDTKYLNKLEYYVGKLPNIFFINNKYKVYRGIFLKKDQNNLDIIKNNNYYNIDKTQILVVGLLL